MRGCRGQRRDACDASIVSIRDVYLASPRVSLSLVYLNVGSDVGFCHHLVSLPLVCLDVGVDAGFFFPSCGLCHGLDFMPQG